MFGLTRHPLISIGIIILLILSRLNAYSQKLPVTRVPIDSGITKQTFTYAIKDTSTLRLDIYTKDSFNNATKRPCVIFVFGGAFIGGQRDNSIYYNYFNFLAAHNANAKRICGEQMPMNALRRRGFFATNSMKIFKNTIT